MPVFENLKNFIRHGKQAHTTGPSNHISQHALESDTDLDSIPIILDDSIINGASDTPTTPGNETVINTGLPIRSGSAEHLIKTTNHDRKDAYKEAAKQMIDEENKQKSKLPSYETIERYKLLEKMGDGAFSVVYKAQHRDTGDYVAIKVIHKQELSISQRSTILKEVTVMRQLKHKNIVSLIDFSENNDYYFIVLELIPGGELFHQIVRLTYFSEDLSRHVIVQVADAIRYLHEEAGVVHRDIKPENLLFYPSKYVPSPIKQIRKGEDENKADEGIFIPGQGAGGIGVIKLADFGLSKVIWDSKTMTPCGTVGYTAPEIVKDEKYSKSVDMWALGCVLYTILCGFPPFYDESIEALTEKVARGQYTFLSPWWDEISPEAKDLVSHLLTVDPESRYSIDQFLNHPWVTKGSLSRATNSTVKSDLVPITDKSIKVSQAEVAPITIDSAATSATALKNKSKASRFEAGGVTPGGFLSPAAVALKEIFDVSNAVHRMEEENARSRRRGIGSTHLGLLNEMTDEDEEQDDEDVGIRDFRSSRHDDTDHRLSAVEREIEKISMDGASKGGRKSRADTHRSSRKRANAPHVNNAGVFELHLDGSTLIERRKRAAAPVISG